MPNLIHGEFSIELNGDKTFLDCVSEAEIYIYERNKYQKLKVIYSEKNDKLLLLNINMNNIQPIYCEDFIGICKSLVENAVVFKNKKIEELLLRQTETKRNKVDNNGLERIGDIFSLIENENNIYKVSKDFIILAEDSYKIKPEKLFLIRQDVGANGEIILNFTENDIKKIRLYKDFQICGLDAEGRLEPICLTIYTDMKFEDNQFVLKFCDEFSLVGNSRISGLSANVRNPLELIEFMLSKTNLNFEMPDYEYRERSYLCVIPIKGLLVRESFGLGIIEFVPRGYLEVESNLFSELLAESNSETFAKVYLTASSYNEAEIIANEITNKAIDFLYHIQRTDSLFLDKDSINLSWSRSDYKTVTPSKEVLIQDTITNEYICTLNKQEEINLLKLDLNKFDEIIDSISWYERCLTNEMDGETKKNIKTIFIAIRYLRKSWDSMDLDDKLINTSIAYEFMLEDEKVEKFIDKGTKNLISTNSKEFALSILEGDDREAKAQEVFERVNFSLSSTILEQKFVNLLTRLNIELTELDKLTLKSVREMRNKLVHGRGVPEISVKTINLANGIIAFLLLNKLRDRVK